MNRDLELVLLLTAYRSLDSIVEGVRMNDYWSQWDKSELDAMHGIEDDDRHFQELVRMNEDLGDISDDPCAECSGCNSCLGMVL